MTTYWVGPMPRKYINPSTAVLMAKIMKLMGTILLISGVLFLIMEVIFAAKGGRDTDWGESGFYMVLIFASILLIDRVRSVVYRFIGWDGKRIEYMLAGQDKIKRINIADIKSVEIKAADIRLKTNVLTEDLKLGEFSYNKLVPIKEYFEALKLRVEGMNAPE